MKEIEEAAEKLYPKTQNQVINFANGLCRYVFIEGAKWQAERMYSDMQEYATFCIECDRKQMPILLVKDWYEHYKNEQNDTKTKK